MRFTEITEGVREGQVYHWTTGANLIRILADDCISMGASTHNLDGQTLRGVSVTRDAYLDLSKTYAISGRKIWRIGLSLERLRHNYKVMPIRDEYLRNRPRGVDSVQKNQLGLLGPSYTERVSHDEREEFVLSAIAPLSRFITSIAVVEDLVDPTVDPSEFATDPEYYESEYDLDQDDQNALFGILGQASPSMFKKLNKGRRWIGHQFNWPNVPFEIIRDHSSEPVDQAWRGYLNR